MQRLNLRSGTFPVLFFTLIGFFVMGYHPGAEDDGIYLAAVKAAAHPGLFPHDSQFFQLQMRTSIFDTWMAHFVHFTGISVGWAELAGQFLSILLMLWACWTILSQLFEERAARWGGLALFSAMLTIPVSGTALYIADQYLHPRNPATALILFAVSRILVGRRWQALPLLIGAFMLHPLMGSFGFSFCFILTLTFSAPVRQQIRSWRARLIPETADAPVPLAAAFPFVWLFDKPSDSYLNALHSRHCFFLYDWTWYEWLGAIAPLAIFWFVARFARKQGQLTLARFASAILIYGVIQQALAMVLLGPKALISFVTLEPMRFLQLIYVFLTLLGGAYIGKYFLRGKALRWAVFLAVANGGMFIAQRALFAATPHIELPDQESGNPWLQTFDWIRKNTPEDAYFALDPRYMSLDGEDNHGFRALAERSVLVDSVKDPAVITKAPILGPEWEREAQAQLGWEHFQLADFQRLNREFGVGWVVVAFPAPASLDCRWHNNRLSVCRIP